MIYEIVYVTEKTNEVSSNEQNNDVGFLSLIFLSVTPALPDFMQPCFA
jgi:hypothetical protein